MSSKEKGFFATILAVTLVLSLSNMAFAMHIVEGFLPKTHALGYGVACVPFITLGVIKINRLRSENPKIMLLLAMVGAYAFALSALKIPSVTGSSSHPTGLGLGAVLFGPVIMSVLSLIILLFQGLFLAHGGITTLGANIMSMGVVGPFVSFFVYKAISRFGGKRVVAVFFAASLGNLFTYCVTSAQLAFAHPAIVGGVVSAFKQFMAVFALTQVPIAIIEGFLTVAVITGLETYTQKELKEIGFIKGGQLYE